MIQRERFMRLFEQLTGTPVSIESDGILLPFEQRLYHLGLNPDRGEIAISTMVYACDPEGRDVFADLIADFNVTHLFHGGYRLNVDAKSPDLYVTQTKRIESLEGAGLAAYLADLKERCISCTRWYAGEARTRAMPKTDMTKSNLRESASSNEAARAIP